MPPRTRPTPEGPDRPTRAARAPRRTAACLTPAAPSIRAALAVALLSAGCAGARASLRPAAAGPRTGPHISDARGSWDATVTQAGGLELRVPLRVDVAPDGRWTLHSRPGAITPLIGRPRALLGRVLGKLPPRGALVTGAGNAVAAGDSTRLRGTVTSPLLGRLRFAGVVAGGRLVGEFRRDSAGPVAGRLTATPAARDPGEGPPVQDYRALAADVRASFERRLYDPRLLETPAYRAFFRDLGRRLGAARDDADAIAAFYAVRRQLPGSHIEFFRNPALAATPLDSLLAGRGDPASRVSLRFPAPGVALLRVTRWEAVSGPVARAFARIDSAGAHTLVLDMRGNEGGDVSAMTPATYLLRDSTPGGAFLGRGWYAAHAAAPTAAESRTLPVLTEGDAAGARQLMRALDERGAATAVVPPRAPHFGGEVYLLVDRRAGSASEPLAYLLKATGRATLVGEPTAGAMLSAPPRPLADGWVLVVPEADYVTADGVRLEGRGVTPDVAVPSAEALVAVAERLRATTLARAPYAGALLLGAANADAARWADAERWYRAARALAPESVAPARGLAQVLGSQQQWDSAAVYAQAVLTRAPDDREVLYQLGRTAALAGRPLDRGEAALRRYLALPPDPTLPSHAAAQWRLGTILARRGALGDARRAYEAALRLDPTLAAARDALQTLRGGDVTSR